MKLIYTIIFSILLLSRGYNSLAICHSQNSNFQISIFKDASDTLGVEEVKTILNTNRKCFVPANSATEPFSPKAAYWLYIQPRNIDNKEPHVLTFHVFVSHIEVYPYPFIAISEYGGLLVPGRLKALSGCNVLLKPGASAYLVKVQNSLASEVSVKKIEITTSPVFQNEKEKYNFVQGFVQGFIWLTLIYNLVLFFLAKKRLNLFYVIYIFFNSLFLLYTFGYSERYIFPDNYRLNVILGTFQLIGMFFYIMFLRRVFLSHCKPYTPSIDRRSIQPWAYVVLVANMVIGSTIFYMPHIFTTASDISNLINSIIAIAVFIYIFKSSDTFLRIIIAGTVVVIVFGWVNLLYAVLNLNADNLFYEFGLLIELLLLTYALNKEHFAEQYEVEMTKHQLERELETKNRELVYMALQLSAKEEAIASIKEKIKEFGHTGNPGSLILSEPEFNNTSNNGLWKDFEVHFTETHPDFYRILMDKYPELTQGEIRLCAFLKLNLNTKEIASITRKSAKSIEVMRSRIRQKINLQRDSNLVHVLSHL